MKKLMSSISAIDNVDIVELEIISLILYLFKYKTPNISFSR